MESKTKCGFPLPPQRKELSENPINLCHDVARLSRAKARDTNIDGIMSQPGARLVLGVLAVNDGISQRELVESTHLKAPTVSVILQSMEDEGLAERRRNPDDRREMRVHLTDYGRRVDMEVISKIKETDALALEGISSEEQELLMSLLGRIRQNLISSLNDNRKERRE